MSAVIAPSQCPIAHAASALDSIEWGISVIDEVASMVAGIHAMTALPIEELTLAGLKKRMMMLNCLALLTVRFTDGRSDTLGEIRDQAEEVIDKLKLNDSECWLPAVPGLMPKDDMIVIAWDSVGSEPSAARYDADEKCWYEQSDGAKFFEGAITHWRYCHAPEGVSVAGVAA